jgi:hypothetical protein
MGVLTLTASILGELMVELVTAILLNIAASLIIPLCSVIGLLAPYGA